MEGDEYLDFSHSKLSLIPQISSLTKKLNIRRNQITDMTFQELININELDLSDNKIKEISNLEKLPNLRSLDLSYNLISTATNLTESIEELYLIGNDICNLESLHLPNIRILDLACNDLTCIGDFNGCQNLCELYLGSNKITDVPNLSYMRNLRILDLQCNSIEFLDCKLLPQSLEELLLSGNQNLTKIENIHVLTKLNLLAVKNVPAKITSFDNLEIWK